MYYRKSSEPVALKALSVENIELGFGGVQALSDVSIGLSERIILGIIGPNGAGKTCVLNCISGFYRPQKGRQAKKKMAGLKDLQSGSKHPLATSPIEFWQTTRETGNPLAKRLGHLIR